MSEAHDCALPFWRTSDGRWDCPCGQEWRWESRVRTVPGVPAAACTLRGSWERVPPVPAPKLVAERTHGENWAVKVYDVGPPGTPMRVERYHAGVIEKVGQVEGYRAWTFLAHWMEDPDVCGS